ncbi:MAG: DUF2169 domain-containing protein [Deltaproteobacteria bacterium]|jgi:hypothetical protein|nr:DUF2169 domain-containing protein [Deltaproteobacteria bacterium]MBW2535429.1 DUF2169 domain-containing protein [Deltaproteobacteria bacterium]
MKLINDTPCPAAFVPNAEELDTVVGLFLLALTCRIEEEALVPAADQQPLLLDTDERFEPGDAQFLRRGVSVTASGFVYPRSGPAPSATASLAVGDATRRVEAIGPRVWHRRGASGTLSPTSPRPFSRIEMRWEHAYGGLVPEPAKIIEVDGEATIVPEHPTAYPQNLDGMGFFLRAEQAIDQPLPLLEDPDQLIERWDDRPLPTCLAPCPLWCGVRAQGFIDPEDDKVDLDRLDLLTGRACPRQVFEEVPAGTMIRLEGMRPQGERLSFPVPAAPCTVDVEIGEEQQRVGMLLDAIDIDAEKARVRFVFRRLFRYGLVQHQLRSARFVPTDALRALAEGMGPAEDCGGDR